MHSLKISTASASDLTIIQDLAYHIWPDAYKHILSKEQIDFMLEKMYDLELMKEEQRNGTCFELAKINDTPVGFMAYGPPEHGVLKLHKLYLSQEWHGHGYGSQILQHVIAAGRKFDCKAVELNVNKNNKQATRSYERNGFKVSKSVVTPFGNGFVMDDYVMKHDIK